MSAGIEEFHYIGTHVLSVGIFVARELFLKKFVTI